MNRGSVIKILLSSISAAGAGGIGYLSNTNGNGWESTRKLTSMEVKIQHSASNQDFAKELAKQIVVGNSIKFKWNEENIDPKLLKIRDEFLKGDINQLTTNITYTHSNAQVQNDINRQNQKSIEDRKKILDATWGKLNDYCQKEGDYVVSLKNSGFLASYMHFCTNPEETNPVE